MTQRIVTLKGTIITKLVDVGTRNECDGYFLRTVYDHEIRLHCEGENPLKEPTLKSLIGRRCDVRGSFSGSTLIAYHIDAK